MARLPGRSTGPAIAVTAPTSRSASCPLTTAYGKTLMAEFIYGGKPTPTLPLNPAKENHINWFIKTTGLPILYWDYMLKGYVAFPQHNKNFVEPPAA